MIRLKNFIKTSLLGGFVVILPMAIFFLVVKWLLTIVTSFVSPITNILIATNDMQQIVADTISIIIILFLCFFVGVFVQTKMGAFIFEWFENRFLRPIPGYGTIRETIVHFFQGEEQPFTKVALAKIFNNDTLVTAFITDEHSDGSYTLFVPTGPNPTSGNIYHLPAKYVTIINVPVESTMRSIISCGAGSKRLLQNYLEKHNIDS